MASHIGEVRQGGLFQIDGRTLRTVVPPGMSPIGHEGRAPALRLAVEQSYGKTLRVLEIFADSAQWKTYASEGGKGPQNWAVLGMPLKDGAVPIAKATLAQFVAEMRAEKAAAAGRIEAILARLADPATPNDYHQQSFGLVDVDESGTYMAQLNRSRSSSGKPAHVLGITGGTLLHGVGLMLLVNSAIGPAASIDDVQAAIDAQKKNLAALLAFNR